MIKTLIKNSTSATLSFKKGRSLMEFVSNVVRSDYKKVAYKGHTFTLSTPNQLCTFRAETFATKEPETLEWIESLPEGCVLWDIGANVGLYSVFAGKVKNAQVFAFEPSIFNLEILARNINLNRLTDQITIIPLPLNDKQSVSKMQMTTTELGGALSSFDHVIGFDGKPISHVFSHQVQGFTMDFANQQLNIPLPDYIKLDVDGIEHFILRGGDFVLSQVKGVLIEINDDFHEQASQSNNLLQNAGLTLQYKKHSEMFEGEDSMFKNCFNQIWLRN